MFDEIHQIKGKQAKITKAASQLHCKRRYGTSFNKPIVTSD